MQRIIINIVIILTTCSYLGQLFNVMEFKANCTTMCQDGMLVTTDTCIFTCVVHLEGFPSTSYVTVLLRRKMERFANEVVSLEPYVNCKRFQDKIPYRCTSITETVFSIDVFLNASIDYSEAEMTCKLQIPGESVRERKFQYLPTVVDPTDATGTLVINGHIMSPEQCFNSIPDLNLTLEFNCTSRAQPCVIHISQDDSTHILNGTKSVVHRTILKNSITFLTKYAACNVEKLYNYIICNVSSDVFKMSTLKQPTEKNSDYIKITVSTCLGITALVLVISFFCLRKIIRKYFLRRQNQEELKYREHNENLTLKLLSHIEKPEDGIEYEKEEDKMYVNRMEKCKKYNDHKEFKVFQKLIKGDVEGDEDIYSLIKSMGPLTVKVTVKIDKNPTVFKTGTGWVERVINHKKKENKDCICNSCTAQPKGTKVWSELYVYTSSHVVPEKSETQNTSCILFYDDDKNAGDELIDFLEEKRMENCGTVLLKYTTCIQNKLKLLKKLDAPLKHWRYIHRKISERNRDEQYHKNRVFIVSHVHGGPKMVSVGEWKERIVCQQGGAAEISEVAKYTYTAPTCPGSTGAYVCILGKDHRIWTSHHLHCGVENEGNGYSSFAIDWL